MASNKLSDIVARSRYNSEQFRNILQSSFEQDSNFIVPDTTYEYLALCYPVDDETQLFCNVSGSLHGVIPCLNKPAFHEDMPPINAKIQYNFHGEDVLPDLVTDE